MLTLSEELLLMAIDDDTGKMNLSASQTIHYGLAGAILMELTKRGCLDYQNKKVVLLDRTESGDELLDESLQYMREKGRGRARSLQHWVQALGTHISWRKKHLGYIHRLIENGILRQEESSYLLFFKRDVFPSNQTGAEHAIRQKVREAVLSAESELDEQTFMLIGLMRACKLDHLPFARDEYRTVKKKMADMMKNSPHGKAVSDTIQAMQAAVIVSVSAAAVAASSSSSSS